MRTDPQKQVAFYDSKHWDDVDFSLEAFKPKDPENTDGESVVRSFSGHERNRLFLQQDDNFDDATLVSGADFDHDSRGFAKLDYDQDGWVDIVVSSPMSPRFQIFRNTLGDGEASRNRSVFVRLEGGNTKARKSFKWSSRDAIGAKVLAVVGDTQRMFQRSCGEGLASQNSQWIHVSLGEAGQIDRLEVTWPSGQKTVHENVTAGVRVLLRENGDTEVVK